MVRFTLFASSMSTRVVQQLEDLGQKEITTPQASSHAWSVSQIRRANAPSPGLIIAVGVRFSSESSSYVSQKRSLPWLETFISHHTVIT
jgi:hypothetical protein